MYVKLSLYIHSLTSFNYSIDVEKKILYNISSPVISYDIVIVYYDYIVCYIYKYYIVCYIYKVIHQ